MVDFMKRVRKMPMTRTSARQPFVSRSGGSSGAPTAKKKTSLKAEMKLARPAPKIAPWFLQRALF